MIIDCHAHYAPELMFERLGKVIDKFPSIELLASDGKYRLSFMQRAPTRPVMPRLRETDERHQWMEREKLDAQVVGGWLDAFGYELLFISSVSTYSNQCHESWPGTDAASF